MLPAPNLCCAASLYFELSKKILVLLKISNTHFLNPGPATAYESKACLLEFGFKN